LEEELEEGSDSEILQITKTYQWVGDAEKEEVVAVDLAV
jgi:hypothetical protein